MTRPGPEPWDEPDVAFVTWPADALMIEALRVANRPILHLVPLDVAPPVITEPLEDWVRARAYPLEVQARVEALRRRAQRFVAPTLDESGRLHVGDRWIALSAVEQRLMRPLVNAFRRVVSVEEIRRAVWGSEQVPRNRLDVLILRLRRELATLNLTITNVRGQGFSLTREPSPTAARL